MSDPVEVLANGVKLAGEAVLPGASLLMDGKFVDGAAHAVVGIGARVVLGPVGAVIVAANSFSGSVADRNLWEYLPSLSWGSATAATTAEVAPEKEEAPAAATAEARKAKPKA